MGAAAPKPRQSLCAADGLRSHRYHCHPKKLEDDYVTETTVLGTGLNGSVFKAQSRNVQGTFAVKGLSLKGISKEDREALKAEVEIFISMDHPHVARLVDVYEVSKPPTLFLVMECMEGGELKGRTAVGGGSKFSEAEAAHTMWQILLSINYLHCQGVVHRDLKLENFLYERENTDVLKLIDFGLSNVVEGKGTSLNMFVGTLPYMAPEVLESAYTSQCDLWSCGVIAFALVMGYLPFDGVDSELAPQIKAGQYFKHPKSWAKLSDDCKNFIEALLTVDPAARPTAEEAMKHPFIANRDQTGRRYVTPLAVLENNANTQLNVRPEIIEALIQFAKASKFRRLCFSLMSWSLTAEERGEVRDAFIELDVHRQGVIKLSTLKEVMTNRCSRSSRTSEKAAKRMSRSLVADELHYSDFLAAMAARCMALHEEHFLATFRRFDKGNHGGITVQDLKHVIGDFFSREELHYITSALDPDETGVISKAQFLAYLESRSANPEEAENIRFMSEGHEGRNSAISLKRAAASEQRVSTACEVQGEVEASVMGRPPTLPGDLQGAEVRSMSKGTGAEDRSIYSKDSSRRGSKGMAHQTSTDSSCTPDHWAMKSTISVTMTPEQKKRASEASKLDEVEEQEAMAKMSTRSLLKSAIPAKCCTLM